MQSDLRLEKVEGSKLVNVFHKGILVGVISLNSLKELCKDDVTAVESYLNI